MSGSLHDNYGVNRCVHDLALHNNIIITQIRAHTLYTTGNWSELQYDLCKIDSEA